MPIAKPLYLCNAMPKFTETVDKAHMRRISVIMFDVQIPDAEKDIGLADRIKANESRMVLDWYLLGAVRLIQANGFTASATLEHRKQVSLATTCPVRKWVGDQGVRLAGSDKAKDKAEVYESFRAWAVEMGIDTRRVFLPDREEFFSTLKDVLPGLDISRRRVPVPGIKGNQLRYCAHIQWGGEEPTAPPKTFDSFLSEYAPGVAMKLKAEA
ncbi:MAG: hypothetical protein U1C04_24390 [Hydrogenophaga sp.]|uniref:hypothetical protein n=1 Tax=Hydrogenophaga sp. TaxID=1904254 RepID=UPI002ABA1FBF|nr:hypothetical protein [Hydrogenophaga sp.]MDZ4283886.1 hypothetical protein [Hydrogenophaga sp.]